MHVFTTHGTNDVSFNFAWKHKSAAELTILKRDRESTTSIHKSTYIHVQFFLDTYCKCSRAHDKRYTVFTTPI